MTKAELEEKFYAMFDPDAPGPLQTLIINKSVSHTKRNEPAWRYSLMDAQRAGNHLKAENERLRGAIEDFICEVSEPGFVCPGRYEERQISIGSFEELKEALNPPKK